MGSESESVSRWESESGLELGLELGPELGSEPRSELRSEPRLELEPGLELTCCCVAFVGPVEGGYAVKDTLCSVSNPALRWGTEKCYLEK